MDSMNISRAGPPGTTHPAVVAGQPSRGEAIGLATLRGLAALLLGVLAAATRPVEGSADLVAAEPSDHCAQDDGSGLNPDGPWVAAGSGAGSRV